MRKPLLGISLVLLLAMGHLIATAPIKVGKSLRAQLNPNYLRAMAAYKRLETKLPREELRAITTIGILNGAKEAEQQMEQHLINVVKDLVHTDAQDTQALEPKITQIEQQLQRDRRALQVLTSAMDLAMHSKDVQTYTSELQQTLQEIRQQQAEDEPPKLEEAELAPQKDGNLGGRVAVLRQNILQQVSTMKDMVEQKIEHTLDYLIASADENGLVAKASNKMVHKRHTSSSHEEPAEVRMIKSILSETDFRDNLVEGNLEKRKDELDSLEDNFDFEINKEIANHRNTKSSTKSPKTNKTSITTTSITTTTTKTPKSAKQEEGSPEIVVVADAGVDGDEEPPAVGGGGGGLVGIIASLSGGEGGSDVGALIGSLTGVVSTLFGPGGLDIESLISTGTSLISGLLAGNRNFGTVLGIYVGTAFDGLSGGGGAVNNGQFIGNFLGTVVASLSADPEDDDEPPKPFLFAQNLLSSFLEAKNRKSPGEGDNEERRHDQMGHGGGGGSKDGKGGSDSGGFIKHIASHLVGSIVSLLLNASLGASGGASHASSSLFATSSSHAKTAASGHGG